MSDIAKIADLKQMLLRSGEEWSEAREGDDLAYVRPWARRDRDVIDSALLLIAASMGDEEPVHALGGIVEDEKGSDFEIFVLTSTCAIYTRFDSASVDKVSLIHRSALNKLDSLRAEYSNDGQEPLIREYVVEYRDGPKVHFPLRKNRPTKQIAELFHELRDDLSFVPN